MSPTDVSWPLPDVIIGNAELAAADNELDILQDFFKQTKTRVPGTTTVQLPKGSKLLEAIAQSLNLNLLTEADRQKMAKFLQDSRRSPTVRISLASEPSTAMVAKLVAWLRASINPRLLVDISLQPGIGAGCVVRTKTKQFDFSLRRHFADKHEVLADYLGGMPTSNNSS